MKTRRAVGTAAVLVAAAVAAGDEAPPQDAKPQPDAQAEADRLAEASGDANPYPLPGEIVVSAADGVPLTYAGGRDIVDHDTLTRYPDGNVTSVLRRVPGVTILPENGNDSRLNIGLRGSDPRRSGFTTILVDGVPISEAPYGNTDVDGLPVAFERIARIDVIRGGASIRWGPNSAGGVISMLTTPIPEEQTARFGARYGSNDDWSAATSVGGTWDKLGVLVEVVGKGGDGYRENSDYSDQDVALKFRYEFDERNAISGGISRLLELDAEQPGGLTQAAYEDDPSQSLRHGFDFRYSANVYRLDYMHTEGKDSAFELFGWIQDGFRGLYDFRPVLQPFDRQRTQNSDFNSGALEARYSWATRIFGAKNSFFHSARYLSEKNRELYENIPFGQPPSRPYPLDAVFSADAFSMFHEDTISLTDTVDLALGARFEDIDMRSNSRDTTQPPTERAAHYQEILPGGSLTWQAMKGAALYASYQENFLTPQYETGFDPTSAAYRPVEPEHSNTREVGTRVRAVRGLELTAAYFDTRYRDKIDFVNLPNGDKVAVNSGRARSHGVESGASFEFGSVAEDLRGLSMYGTATRVESTITSGVNDGNFTPNSPQTVASWGVTYEHCTGLWARVGGSHTGPSFKDPENFPNGSADGVTGPLPGYTLWDAAVGWHEHDDGSGLAVSVGVTNLTDYDYFRRFSTGIYPGAPRQFFASASWTGSW